MGEREVASDELEILPDDSLAKEMCQAILQAEQAAREDERTKLLETHVDKALALDKVTAARKEARVKALEEAAQYHDDAAEIWENTKPPHRLRADNHKIFARDIRALKET